MTPNDRPIWQKVLENILIGATYYATARVGQMLAIPPGNISPVWLPSGIILGAMLIRGYYLWPGILLGALIGNAWTYADTSGVPEFILSILPGLANGTGDAIAVVFATWCIRRFTDKQTVFKDIGHLSIFILFGCIISPLISALFGIGSLRIAGNVEAENFWYALVTWWTGDGVGVLILTPFMLIWLTERYQRLRFNYADVVIFAVLIISSVYLLGYIPNTALIRLPTFTLAPILIWSVFRQDIRFTYTSILLVSALAIFAGASAIGPFSDHELNISLINLQLFLAVLTMTVMYLQATVIELQELNAERGLLLKEIHHRVKNNLQVIAGLLILQSRSSNNESVKVMLRESQHRINSMALIHEMLYQSDQLLAIDMDEYLGNLMESLANSILGFDNDIRLDIDARDIRLTVDTGIPLGLLITEIATNSLKHGLKHDGTDRIYIQLKRLPDEKLQLRIGDNGKGMSPENNPSHYTSLGLKLVQSLTEQLSGTIKREPISSGTHYTLKFQEVEK